MRSVVCDDETFARLVGDGGLYDYEMGERYVMAPAAANDHAALQGKLIAALSTAAPDLLVTGPTNLGRLGEPGDRWYVVPDVVVVSGAERGGTARLEAAIAVEIRSPGEDMAAKLADYRTVMERTSLDVGEVWYVNGREVIVHPAAGDPGGSAHPELLTVARATVNAWHARPA